MPVTHVGQTTLAGTSTASVVLSVPAGVVNQDRLYAVLTTGWGSYTVTPPAGWTLLIQQFTSSIRVFVYTRLAGTSEPSTYTFNWNTAFAPWNAAMFAVRGASVTPHSVARSVETFSNVNTAPSVFPSADNTAIYTVFVNSNSTTSGAWTPPSGFTEAIDMGSTAFGHLEVAYRIQPTATLVTPSATFNTGTSNGAAIVFTIQPAELDVFGSTTIAPLPAGTEVQFTGVTTTNVSPPPVIAGNLMILAVLTYPLLTTLTTPAGWTLRSSTPVTNAGNDARYWLFTKVAGASEAALSLTFSSSTQGGAQIFAYQGVDSILDDDATAVTNASSLSFPTSNSGGNAGVAVVRFVPLVSTNHVRAVRVNGLIARGRLYNGQSTFRINVFDEFQSAAGNSPSRSALVYEGDSNISDSAIVGTANIVLKGIVLAPVGVMLNAPRIRGNLNAVRPASGVAGAIQLADKGAVLGRYTAALSPGANKLSFSSGRITFKPNASIDTTPPTIVFAVRGR